MQTVPGMSLLQRCLAMCAELAKIEQGLEYLCADAAQSMREPVMPAAAGLLQQDITGLLSGTSRRVCSALCPVPGTLRLRRCTTARAEFEQELARVSGPSGGGEQVVLVALATVVFLSQSYRPTRIPAHVRELLIAGHPDS